MAQAGRDQNFVPTLLGVSSSDGTTPVAIYADPTTHRLLTDTAAGSGTVTSVSVVTANGFAGTVANATTTPAITLTTTVTGILQGNGTAISAATTGNLTDVGTDGITITGGTGAVLGSGTSISQHVADATHNGYLSSTDWTTFNNKGSGTVTSVSGTLNRITSTGGATPVIDISASYVGQTSITTLGTVTTGTLSTGAIIGGVTMTLGSDAAYDVYYRGATGVLTRLANGTTGQFLSANTGAAPTWGTPAGTGANTALSNLAAVAINTSLLPGADDGAALGSTTKEFSDLFLASGGVINWANGNVTLTQSSGILTQNNGELRITSANVGTNADSVPTLSSTSTLTNKTLTSPTIQTTPVYAAGTNLILTVPTSDDTATGEITNAFNSGYTSSAIGDLVYLDSSGTWQKADADASVTTYSGILGIALEVKASGNALKVLLRGFAYCSTAFPTFTVGATVYMSATPGAVTATAPTATDSAVRVLGWAVHADKIWFNPSGDYVTNV